MASPTVLPPSIRTERPTKLAISTVATTHSPGSALQASPSSGASTPTSINGHQLAIKPSSHGPHSVPLDSMASTPDPQPRAPKSFITSKEWIIPPRPKPGRKPATDTPPTKRKAQNRAAQRAFRERRAARVGELEEQLDEHRRDYEKTQQDLQDRCIELDLELHDLRTHCTMIEGMLDKERMDRERISSELEIARRQLRDERASFSSHQPSLPGLHAALSQHHTPRSSITSIHSGHRNSSTVAISQLISPQNSSNMDSPANRSAHEAGCGRCDPNGPCACVEEVLVGAGPVIDCGKCTLGTRCECLEAALNSSTNTDSDLKRKPSSISLLGPEEKRQRPNHSENEIDFTAMFSRKRVSTVVDMMPEPVPQLAQIRPRDSCGFCTEGTYCMCAEAAAAEAQLPPLGSQVQTPPPDSDHDIGPLAMEFTSTGAVKLPRLASLNRPSLTKAASRTSGCGPTGPGSCATCLADPKAGLFCRSLAAVMEQSGSAKSGGGCCGGQAGGGCCKSKPVLPNIGLSVADAYKTLSSHRNFDRASDDISSWLPKLRAVPKPQEVGEGSTGRSQIEVETASIMSVLKGFDVRFGREP